MQLQLFTHGQVTSKAGTFDVEKIGRNRYKLVYWNCVGCISAVALYDLKQDGVHLIDCNNPYDNEADRAAVKGMSNIHYCLEIPF